MNVRELFRSKLGSSEVIPASCVSVELMRKLGIKEFMRFNPSRFNIYYSGLILAGAIAGIIIITSRPFQDKDKYSKPAQKTEVPTTINMPVAPVKESTDEKPREISISGNSGGQKKSSEKSEIRSSIKSTEIGGIEKSGSQAAKSDSLKEKESIVENISNKSSQKNNPVELQKTIGASFDVSVTGGCSPLKVKFLNKSVYYDSCQWVFGDGGFSTKRDPEWIFDNPGEYKVVLNVFSSDGNQAIASSLITIHPRPEARFETAPEKPVIPDDEIRFMNFSVDAIRYRWEFGDGNTSNLFEPYHKYRKFNKYNVRLIAWSEYGCSDTVLVKNAFSDSGCFIDFPNAFIPGTDGPVGGYYSTKSDESARIFHPATSGVSEYQLKIFSKLGILIFESNDINIGWDGYVKERLCQPGVYVWKARGTYKNGEPFVKMGDVTIIKN